LVNRVLAPEHGDHLGRFAALARAGGCLRTGAIFAAASIITAPRQGSKTAQVVAMLRRKNGATLAEIVKAMGWQKHTVRGFMAGAMKKAGYAVESFKSDAGERTYRSSCLGYVAAAPSGVGTTVHA
jgi:hypothetical protein